MSPWSPHVYLREAAARRVPEAVSTKALSIATRSQRRELPAILTLRHLAFQTDTSYEYLRKVVARRHDPYTGFRIGKRSGGFRVIVAVSAELRAVQRWIVDRILRVLSRSEVHPASAAYSPGDTPLACARRHVGCRWLLKVDVHRFFESVSEIDVFRVFHRASYEPLVAFELARLCTRLVDNERTWRRLSDSPRWRAAAGRYSILAYRQPLLGHLPQGAPSSPMLANLVAVGLDNRVQAIADRNGLVYSRYSDDLALSTSDRSFTRERARYVLAELHAALGSEGLQANLSKSAIVPPGARKIVLGLNVDTSAPRLPASFKDRLRQHLHFLEKHGPVAHAEARGFRSVSAMIAHLYGLIEYARGVDESFAGAARKRIDAVVERHQSDIND